MPKDLIEKARVLDNYYIPTRYVYTASEWDKLMRENTRFSNMLKQEARWLHEPNQVAPATGA